MTPALALTVYGKPAPAGSKTPGRTRDGRTYVRDSSGRSGSEWRQQVRQIAGERMNGAPLFQGPVALELTFHLPRPKGHYGTKGVRPSAPAWPAVKPDALKLARAVEDALTGTVWRDDAQVIQLTIAKRYGEPARVDITIEEASP